METAGSIAYSSQAVFAPFVKAVQSYALTTAVDTLLICPEGTQIQIPANVFVDSVTGKPVRGVVQFFVREYLTLPDMVLNNLTTTSAGQLIETGGMVQIRAKANSRPLALKPGKTIKVALPRRGAEKPGMQAFAGLHGPDGTLDWRANGPPSNGQPGRFRSLKVRNTNFPPVHLGPDAFWNKPERRMGYSRKQALALVKRGKAGNTRKTRAERHRLGYYRIGVVDRVTVVYEIDAIGVIRNVRATTGYEPELQTAAVNLVQTMQSWEPGWVQREALRDSVSNFFGVLPVRWQERVELEFRRSGRVRMIDFSESISRAVRDTIRLLEKGKLTQVDYRRYSRFDADPRSRYFFQSANLNWINCDRFLRQEKESLVALKVDVGDALVRLVFRDIRAIMAPTGSESARQTFQQIPAGRPVLILAMRTVDGKLEVATRETTVSSGVEGNLEFRPMQPDELKQTLAALDH